MVHISPCSFFPEDMLGCFFSLSFLYTHTRSGNLAPEEASQSQSPWDEPAVIARHYIMMVSHSLGFRDSRTNAQIHYGLNSLWQLSQGKPCEKVDFWLWEKHKKPGVPVCTWGASDICRLSLKKRIILRLVSELERWNHVEQLLLCQDTAESDTAFIRCDIKLTVCMRQHKTPTQPEGLDASLNISGDHRKQSTSPEAKLQVSELCVRFQINTSKCFL